MTVHHDLDLISHPELDGEVHRAVVAEHTKAHEDYKNEMLPKVAHLIRQRCKEAREEAIRCYCEKRGLQRHHVMSRKERPLTSSDNGIKDTNPAAEVRANVPPT